MRRIEVTYLLDGTLETDTFTAERSVVKLSGKYGDKGSVIRLWDGTDVQGRSVRHALYRHAERVITYEE